MNQFVSGFLYTIIAYGTPLILCSLGGMMTGLSGRFNLGMEGMMLFAAFFSLYFANLWNSLLLGLLMGVGITVLIGLFMALMTLRLGVDIYIVGMGINLLGTGLTTFLIYVLTGSQGSIIYPNAPRLAKLATPLIEKIPYLNQVLSNHTWLDYLAIVLVVVLYAVIFKTAFGRRLRAVGMSEWVASARGISVDGMIYASYAVCGALCGLAGASLSLSQGIFVGGFVGMTNGAAGSPWRCHSSTEQPVYVLFSAWALGALSAAGISCRRRLASRQAVQMLPFLGALVAASIYSYRR
jgi:simple sugar transport system permease protein